MCKMKLSTFDDLWEQSRLTSEEKEKIKLKVELVGKIIEAREENDLKRNSKLTAILFLNSPINGLMNVECPADSLILL